MIAAGHNDEPSQNTCVTSFLIKADHFLIDAVLLFLITAGLIVVLARITNNETYGITNAIIVVSIALFYLLYLLSGYILYIRRNDIYENGLHKFASILCLLSKRLIILCFAIMYNLAIVLMAVMLGHGVYSFSAIVLALIMTAFLLSVFLTPLFLSLFLLRRKKYRSSIFFSILLFIVIVFVTPLIFA